MAENSDNIASIEAARAAANDRANKLHGASEDLIAAEGRRVDAEIEATARLLCIATGRDPDEQLVDRVRWEEWIDDARMMLSPANPGTPDAASEYYFPGERDEPAGIAPESLEQMHEADVETALIQRALAAEMKLEGLSMSLHEAYADNERTRAEMDGEMNRIAADAALVHNQRAFLSSALTRQFERVAGLRLYGGDMRAEQVVPFVQAEVDAVNATLTAIENRRVVS